MDSPVALLAMNAAIVGGNVIPSFSSLFLEALSRNLDLL